LGMNDEFMPIFIGRKRHSRFLHIEMQNGAIKSNFSQGVGKQEGKHFDVSAWR
jgi:hypothetical protein